MIARIWRGVIRAEHVEEYLAYIETTGGGEYKRTPGNRGAWVMSRTGDDRAEIIALSFWDSREAIEGFAGPDIEKSVLYPEDEKYLLEPSTITHYEITLAPDPSPNPRRSQDR
jgi:heme-degrading monooxygenase HmoA